MRRTLGLASALILLLATAASALPPEPTRPAATRSDATPTTPAAPAKPEDRPLPGYTIADPVLPPALVGGEPARVLQGVHERAAYAIEVPPRWNGRLVMWAHGYRGRGTSLVVDAPDYGLRHRLLDQGFAWAASSYYANGYHVKAGVESTHDLALRFAELVGEPSDVFIAGVSMGGHVIVRSLEQYPGFYRAALPMCGVLGDQELFDYVLDYQLVAQALAGVDAYPLPTDYPGAVVPKIKTALGLYGTPNELGEQFAAFVAGRSGGERPGVRAAFAHWKDFLFDLAVNPPSSEPALDPLRLATNLDTRYAPNAPVDLERVVRRVAPRDAEARRTPELTEVPRVDGRPSAPVLSLHGLGDLFVPFSMEQRYLGDVGAHGRSDLLVQRAIRTVGHCEFSPAEVGRAWDDLVHWADAGTRPAGDVVDDPAVVADPGYGCRFTDPAARGTGTRELFPAC
ncbi:DUF6351 family protein [Actinosynnema sp. NPDC023587]|uniref:DUF6351 family protein n=1 Tax=Actinosynnema sp. NPDC023587 TaxID=3154695 RepID=UPI0033F1803B